MTAIIASCDNPYQNSLFFPESCFCENVTSSGLCLKNSSIYSKLSSFWLFFSSQKQSNKKLFQDTVTNVVVDISIVSDYQENWFNTTNIAKGSIEELFIDREDLHDTVQLAEDLIKQIFNTPPSISYEYCSDYYEEGTIEWLDVNLHYRVVDDAEIEVLLDKMDELNEVFSKKVHLSKELMLNFHLDII